MKNQTNKALSDKGSISNYHDFSEWILSYAAGGHPRIEFLFNILRKLIHLTECQSASLWLVEKPCILEYRVNASAREQYGFRTIKLGDRTQGLEKNLFNMSYLYSSIVGASLSSIAPFLRNDILWIPDIAKAGLNHPDKFCQSANCLLGIPLYSGTNIEGCLGLYGKNKDTFSQKNREQTHILSSCLARAIVNHFSQSSLRERVKELSCLYEISRICENQELSLEKILHQIADSLPLAFQYPDIASCRITVCGQSYQSPPRGRGMYLISAPVETESEVFGTVELTYAQMGYPLYGTPFLAEEQKLLNTVGLQIALIIERDRHQCARKNLEKRLQRSDRLATIGLLSSGIAHELNQPLGSILGFAQLMRKDPKLSEKSRRDIEKIISASLYTREVLKNLLVFAKQQPPSLMRIDLNEVIMETLDMVEDWETNQKATIVRNLSITPLLVMVDVSQIKQVLINLVINGFQAMPDGGVLTITASQVKESIALEVKDTGRGIAKDDLERIFVPFFSTKETGKGIGLGLAVVHGIVESHGGSVDVISQQGKGSTFRVFLPLSSPAGKEVKYE